jgi:hypothetical protein
MSEYGIKIDNYTAGSIFEVTQGVRVKYDKTPAMLTNSLFKDFLVENGLKLWKGESTRDIICIDYKYGSCSYKEAVKRLQKQIKENRIERRIAKSQGIKHLIDEAERKKRAPCRWVGDTGMGLFALPKKPIRAAREFAAFLRDHASELSRM